MLRQQNWWCKKKIIGFSCIVTETILVLKNGYEVYFVLFLGWSTGTLVRIQNKSKHEGKPLIQDAKCSTNPQGVQYLL